jgi:signal peptidase II
VRPLRPSIHGLVQALIPAAVFLADRASKLWVLARIPEGRSVEVLPFLRLTHVRNTGSVWGFFQGSNPAMIALTAALLGVLLFQKRLIPSGNRAAHAAVCLVIGGALGNLYDRAVLGFVVDFLDFIVWPVFNLADSCICSGAALLAWSLRENYDRIDDIHLQENKP